MAKFSGKDGACVFDGDTINITDFSLEVAGEVIDTTDSSVSDWKTFIASGFKSWSGSFEGFYESATASQTVGATAATLTLTVSAGVTLVGSAIITRNSFTLNVPGADAVKIGYDFQGTGTLTETNA